MSKSGHKIKKHKIKELKFNKQNNQLMVKGAEGRAAYYSLLVKFPHPIKVWRIKSHHGTWNALMSL